MASSILGPENLVKPSPASGDAVPEGVADAAERRGGVSSNTPPSNPKSNRKTGTTTGGEDWFEITLSLRHGNFPELRDDLDKAKGAAEAGQQPHDEVEFAGQRFICRPLTARAGSGSKRIAYHWVLDSDAGYTLLLMNRSTPHKTMPNGIVRFTSMPLLRHGTLGCMDLAARALKAMGVTGGTNKLSRVDLCVDLGGISIDPFYEAFKQGHYLTRARHSLDHIEEFQIMEHRYGRTPTGFELGRRDVKLRVYDKARELRYQWEKLDLMEQHRWGEPFIRATRVEYQVRREKLKALGVDTVEDWYEKRAAIAEYLSSKWACLTDGPVDPKHRTRPPVLPLWKTVQEYFASWCGESVEVALEPLPKSPANVGHLLKQSAGLTLTILAILRRPITDNDSLVQEAMYLLAEEIEGRDMAEEYRRRVLEVRSRR